MGARQDQALEAVAKWKINPDYYHTGEALKDAMEDLLNHSIELPEEVKPEEVTLVLLDYVRAIKQDLAGVQGTLMFLGQPHGDRALEGVLGTLIGRIQGVIESLPKTE